MTASIKGKSTRKQIIRQDLREHTGDLVHYVNHLIDAAQAQLREKGKAGLVMIVDQLDRIHRRDFEEGGNSHNRLYIDHGDLLCKLNCHVIYTMPISLTLDKDVRLLSGIFKTSPLTLSMIRIKTEQGQRDGRGYKAFQTLLDKRIPTQRVFTEGALDLLIHMSGGHPRYLMQLIQTTCEFAGDFPIGEEVVIAACRDRRNNEFARTISESDWTTLVDIQTTKSLPNDEHAKELLFYQYVLEYVNGQPWYDVHPLIPSLKKFSAAWLAAGHEPLDDPLQ